MVMQPSSSVLLSWARQGHIGPDALEAALLYLGIRPDPAAWRRFWLWVLQLGGALSLVCGVIFFIAWNWADMHPFAKFGLLQALLAACLGAALYKGPETHAGVLCLLGGGILVGPLLAVYGQTYQTGAEVWELFRGWTLALLPLALAGQRPFLFFLLWITASLWGGLHLLQEIPISSFERIFFQGDSNFIIRWMYFQAGQAAFLLAWEIGSAFLGRTRPWLRTRWLPRLVFFALSASLTVSMAEHITSRHINIWHISLYLGVLVAGGSWRRRPDLFMEACGLCSLAALLAVWLIQVEFLMNNGITVGLLGWSLLISGFTAVVIRILRFRQGNMAQPAATAPECPDAWTALRRHLEARGLLKAGVLPPVCRAPGPPWFVSLVQGLGGWLAACLLLGGVAALLILTLDIRDAGVQRVGFLLFGGAALLAANLCASGREQFGSQFSLALALTGMGGLGAALAEWASLFDFMTLAFMALAGACGVAIAYCLHHAFIFRVIASCAFFFCVMFAWLEVPPLRLDRAEIFLPLDGLTLTLHALFWGSLCLLLIWGQLREKRWRLSQARAAFLEPGFLGLYIALLCFLVFCEALGDMHVHIFDASLKISSKLLGVCAGAALARWTFGLAGAWRAPTGVRLGLAAAAGLLIPAGWFLPGLSLSLLGLALCRQAGSRPLLGVTGCFLLAYFTNFYYTLTLSLLYKSILLAGSGALLLILAGLLAKILPKGQNPNTEEAAPHAA
ncbi:MAG: DUF4401 domain-containing protein [Desulfovibrio sp.]|jgi:uncharacterized membrane protein|nr:DUF4401 domain-containing protein [Desulfovibrio sp.]